MIMLVALVLANALITIAATIVSGWYVRRTESRTILATMMGGAVVPLIFIALGIAGSLSVGSGLDDPPPGALLMTSLLGAASAAPISFGIAWLTARFLLWASRAAKPDVPG